MGERIRRMAQRMDVVAAQLEAVEESVDFRLSVVVRRFMEEEEILREERRRVEQWLRAHSQTISEGGE
jgi:hypothetical protein